MSNISGDSQVFVPTIIFGLVKSTKLNKSGFFSLINWKLIKTNFKGVFDTAVSKDVSLTGDDVTGFNSFSLLSKLLNLSRGELNVYSCISPVVTIQSLRKASRRKSI